MNRNDGRLNNSNSGSGVLDLSMQSRLRTLPCHLNSWHFNPQVPKTKVIDLATGLFVERHECVLLVGPTGTGKSHIAQALGLRACRAGATVLFTSAQQLLTELRAARADHSYDKKLLRFTSPALLIIDELGLKPLRGDEPLDLYEVIRQRYDSSIKAGGDDHHLKSGAGGMATAVWRPSVGQCCHGPPSPSRPHSDHGRRLLPDLRPAQKRTRCLEPDRDRDPLI